MASKNVKLKNALLIGVLALLVGFLAGELLPLPFVQGYTLTGSMGVPGVHIRR